ncbi:hypothetical protein BJ508DRAFT_87980 [Ascobolus immersus RN42]|uniref:Nephrocystin 3-like N-terminal domain-containing protein n=1 Tax=Ascobolus immersus RN42 TaxID=1160509 RepID=A0A3N4HDE8_ASCIM|nr:hypothetical protein BJ508DRAFT_87980 [Ascobolus immersus RN42]
MDGVGTAANLIAVIQLAAQTSKLVYDYVCKVKDCPATVRDLHSKLEATQKNNDQIHKLADRLRSLKQPPGDGEWHFAITELATNTADCKEAIEALKKELEVDLEALAARKAKGKWKVWKTKLKWPLKEAEVISVTKRLEFFHRSFHLALQIDTTNLVLQVIDAGNHTTSLVSNVAATTEDMKNLELRRVNEEKLSRLLRWLSPYHYDSKHQESKDRHIRGTGAWVFNDPVLIRWRSTRGARLWIHGIPGAGKTILASTIIDFLEEELENEPESSLAYFYCQYSKQPARDPVQIARSILAQCFSKMDYGRIEAGFPELVGRELRVQAPPESIDSLCQHVLKAVSFYSDVYVVLDGIDECPPESRYKILAFLRGISSSLHLHLLVVSRNEADIRKSFTQTSYEMLSLDDRDWALKEDMRIAIRKELGNSDKWSHLSSHLHSLIEERLLHDSGKNMFRWLECQFDLLLRMDTEAEIRYVLAHLPATLFETYDRIILVIQQRSETTAALVKAVLEWLAVGSSNAGIRASIGIPMTAKAMVSLLSAETEGIEKGTFTASYLDETKSFTDDYSLFRSCGAFIRVSSSPDGFYGAPRRLPFPGVPIIEPAHYTMTEYISSDYLKYHENTKLSLFYADQQLQLRHSWQRLVAFVCASDFAQCASQADAARLLDKHFDILNILSMVLWWGWIIDECFSDELLYEKLRSIIISHPEVAQVCAAHGFEATRMQQYPVVISFKLLVSVMGFRDDFLLRLLKDDCRILVQELCKAKLEGLGTLMLSEAARNPLVDVRVAEVLLEAGVEIRTPLRWSQGSLIAPRSCFEPGLHNVDFDYFELHTLQDRRVQESKPVYGYVYGADLTSFKTQLKVFENWDERSGNHPSSAQQVSPIHSAALSSTKKGEELLIRLLNLGCDPNQLLDDGSTPLHYAALSPNGNNLKILLAAGAVPRKNHLGQIPMGPDIAQNLQSNLALTNAPCPAVDSIKTHPASRPAAKRYTDYHRRMLKANTSNYLDGTTARAQSYQDGAQWLCTVIPFVRVHRVEFRARHTHIQLLEPKSGKTVNLQKYSTATNMIARCEGK